jgi:hypothetical protein
VITPETIDALSTDYVQVPIRAAVKGQAVDPRNDVVQLAFMAVGTKPGSGDWHLGSWDSPAPGIYLAQCLIGPAGGTTTLTANLTYDVYAKVYDNPETPVLYAGQLAVT